MFKSGEIEIRKTDVGSIVDVVIVHTKTGMFVKDRINTKSQSQQSTESRLKEELKKKVDKWKQLKS